jgi:hypothetical protein
MEELDFSSLCEWCAHGTTEREALTTSVSNCITAPALHRSCFREGFCTFLARFHDFGTSKSMYFSMVVSPGTVLFFRKPQFFIVVAQFCMFDLRVGLCLCNGGCLDWRPATPTHTWACSMRPGWSVLKSCVWSLAPISHLLKLVSNERQHVLKSQMSRKWRHIYEKFQTGILAFTNEISMSRSWRKFWAFRLGFWQGFNFNWTC